MFIAQTVGGAGILLVAFGGMVFGAIATALVMGYVWGAQASEQERWLKRFRKRIRQRLRKHQVEDAPKSADAKS